jgi:uncharacterized protein DUF3618
MTTDDHGSGSAAPHAATTDLTPAADPPVLAPVYDTTTPDAGPITGPPDDIQELRQEIEDTRDQLADTVQQLAAKADVKARAHDKAVELTQKVKGKASQTQAHADASAANARSQVAGRTAAARQQVMPFVTAGKDHLHARAAALGTPVRDATPEPVRHAVSKTASIARQRRAPLAAAAGALVVAYLAVRSWRRR